MTTPGREKSMCEGSEVCLGDHQKARVAGVWGWGREEIAEKEKVQRG